MVHANPPFTKGLAMLTLADSSVLVTVGVDTHADNHVAVALDELGRVLGTETFPTHRAGYEALFDWAGGFGQLDKAGIEGTGSWGAGLARCGAARGVRCVEVNRPNRQHRRRHGKSDAADALAAARAVQSGEATAAPRGRGGPVEGLRTNRVAHRSAGKARTQAINQLRALIVTAPDQLREIFDGLNQHDVIVRASRFRVNGADEINTTKHAMRSLAHRIGHLTDELAELEALRHQLVHAAAPPALLEEHGVGPHVAADLLIAFGSNPGRIATDAAFAALCGVSPIDASSGHQHRHRLNRGGDRQANNALWRIVTVRMSSHEPTKAYIAKRIADDTTKREAIRSLKRYVARHIWKILVTQQPLDDL